jgi:hypothetical protein
MGELGFGAEKIAEGKALLAQTKQVYNTNQTEDDETLEAREWWKTARAQLNKTYRLHRKKAKVVFMYEPVVLQRLEIHGDIPAANAKWVEMIQEFYSRAANPEILERLERMKITADDIAAGSAMVNEVVAARANYLRETGESQDATQAKDMAMSTMSDWMGEFYAVARIALEERPQLLEALGKPVKS